MANYHFEVGITSRKRGRSAAAALSYQSGKRIRDNYYGKTHNYAYRSDVLYSEILLPPNAPHEYNDYQTFIDAVDYAEKRLDSRTLRWIIGSLPNELEPKVLIEIVREYVTNNFTARGICAAVAIHAGRNDNPKKNNPHAHILLTTREVGPNGFCVKKIENGIAEKMS